jgi:redox-regulated HSP33 family molecular chaperone
MPASDALSRFVLEGAAVRGVRVRLADTTRAILGTHPYPPALARVPACSLSSPAPLRCSPNR